MTGEGLKRKLTAIMSAGVELDDLLTELDERRR